MAISLKEKQYINVVNSEISHIKNKDLDPSAFSGSESL